MFWNYWQDLHVSKLRLNRSMYVIKIFDPFVDDRKVAKLPEEALSTCSIPVECIKKSETVQTVYKCLNRKTCMSLNCAWTAPTMRWINLIRLSRPVEMSGNCREPAGMFWNCRQDLHVSKLSLNRSTYVIKIFDPFVDDRNVAKLLIRLKMNTSNRRWVPLFPSWPPCHKTVRETATSLN